MPVVVPVFDVDSASPWICSKSARNLSRLWDCGLGMRLMKISQEVYKKYPDTVHHTTII